MTAPAGRIQYVERAAHIDFKVKARVGDGGGHRHLRGQMIDLGGGGHGLLDQLRVPDIAHRHLQPVAVRRKLPQPFHVVVNSCPRQVIEDVYLGLCPEEHVARQVRSDEPRASKNQHRTGLFVLHGFPFEQIAW